MIQDTYKDNTLKNWSIIGACLVIPCIVYLIIVAHDESIRQLEIKNMIDNLSERVYSKESCEELTDRLIIDNQYWLKEKDQVLIKIYNEKCGVKP